MTDLVAFRDPSKANILNKSIGLNFGTRVLTGFSTWPVDNYVPEAIRDTAAEVFSFDAFLQNPDRRHNNPNLLVNGDAIMLIDHEMAFSFLMEIFPTPTPWLLERQQYLNEHVFYRRLKSKAFEISGFIARLKALSDEVVEEAFADAPSEWNNDNEPRIRQHLASLRDHADEFADQVRRFLV